MNPDQEKAFKDAEKKASELMACLYHIRNTFYERGEISDNGHGVWQHIPSAQSLLNQVQHEIKKARDST